MYIPREFSPTLVEYRLLVFTYHSFQSRHAHNKPFSVYSLIVASGAPEPPIIRDIFNDIQGDFICGVKELELSLIPKGGKA